MNKLPEKYVIIDTHPLKDVSMAHLSRGDTLRMNNGTFRGYTYHRVITVLPNFFEIKGRLFREIEAGRFRIMKVIPQKVGQLDRELFIPVEEVVVYH